MDSRIFIPNLPELTFSNEEHIYRLNGVEIPSVTKVMELLSANEYRRVDDKTLEGAAYKGTAVHNAIENHIKFGIDDIDPEYRTYLDGFLDWFSVTKPKVIGSEIRTYHRILGYGGTVDLIADIDGDISLVDFKTTYKLIEDNCRVQLEAYAQALKSHGINIECKRILHLGKDGKWKDIRYQINDGEAWRVFGSLKCIYDFLKS